MNFPVVSLTQVTAASLTVRVAWQPANHSERICVPFFFLVKGATRESVRETMRLYTDPLHSLPTKYGVPEVNKKRPECWKQEECQKLIQWHTFTLHVISFNDVIKYLTL